MRAVLFSRNLNFYFAKKNSKQNTMPEKVTVMKKLLNPTTPEPPNPDMNKTFDYAKEEKRKSSDNAKRANIQVVQIKERKNIQMILRKERKSKDRWSPEQGKSNYFDMLEQKNT
ncbi:hypothetical protein NPIL_348181 [Nephila pilipes]|uniref:Uncharacterized protein n=1 Tax=Nephila pilipes TaxID=299642 RepID=A0A8X6U1U7_NEPPI|nr:hypothetical protein NPIL_348181 [Nephila pilipes]